MPYDVAIKEVPARTVASLTVHAGMATIGAAIGNGFGTLAGVLGPAGVIPDGAPFIVYHDVIDEQTDGTIEICIPVPAGASGDGDDVDWKEIPGGPVAWTTHHGPYDEVAPAYHTLTGWITDHGHEITGPPREVYVNDPQTVPPEDLRTEVQFPVRADATDSG